MIKVERIEVWGWEHAIRGMRNPMNSWDRSDSVFEVDEQGITDQLGHEKGTALIGDNDLQLMFNLCMAGPEHRKFMRQLFVSMDITAPLYWWKEFDTYKIGTTANSCSTMHKIHDKEFVRDDFSHEHLYVEETEVLDAVIVALNAARQLYLDGYHKNDWWQMIQLLPSSYNQRRTVTMNYENALNIYHQRKDHKLDEWREFTDILRRNLPLFSEFAEEYT